MIISRLNGGLGNQMFQYALGRVLSEKNKAQLFLDLSIYENQAKVNTPRSYELHIFNNIKARIADQEILNRFTQPNKLKLILNKYLKFNLQAYPQNWIREEGHSFHPEILKLKGDYLLDGYWQTEKYFKKDRFLILNDFAFPKKISSENKNLIKELKTKNSISLHVRRGDYVQNKLTNAYHGVCSLNYYQQAIKYLKSVVKNPWFIVFSDDPRWCEKNLAVPKSSIFIDHNKGKNSFEDMRLMSHCKHNIIANSSFSWWGAWLNQNPDKVVTAPTPWLKNTQVNKKDIYPQGWKKIKS